MWMMTSTPQSRVRLEVDESGISVDGSLASEISSSIIALRRLMTGSFE
jgi:hypothetical protein